MLNKSLFIGLLMLMPHARAMESGAMSESFGRQPSSLFEICVKSVGNRLVDDATNNQSLDWFYEHSLPKELEGPLIHTSCKYRGNIFWQLFSDDVIQSEFKSHRGLRESIDISADSRYVVVGFARGTTAVFDTQSNEWRPVLVLKGHKDAVLAVAVSSDNKYIITGSSDNTARIWCMSSGDYLHELKHAGVVDLVMVSNSNKYAITKSGNIVMIWDIESGKHVHTLYGHTNNITGVALSSDDRVIVTGSLDTTVRIWHLATGECKHVLQDHTDHVNCVAISSDNNLVAAGSSDNSARIWDIHSGQCVRQFIHERSIRYPNIKPKIDFVSISSDNKSLFTCAHNNDATLWDIESGKCHIFAGHIGTLSADGTLVITIVLDGVALVYDAFSNQCMGTLPCWEHRRNIAGKWVKMSPDNKLILTGSPNRSDGGTRMSRIELPVDLKELLNRIETKNHETDSCNLM